LSCHDVFQEYGSCLLKQFFGDTIPAVSISFDTASPSGNDTAIALDVHPGLDTPRLRELLCPDRLLWTPRELRDLTATMTGELSRAVNGILRFDTEQRWWARLGLTDGVELWLLSWLPGQQTEPHDHGGAAGSFSMLQGELAEEYRYPRGPIRAQRHRAGSTIGFGAGHAHQMRNVSELPAASVHAYSPPLVPTREYQSLLDVPDVMPSLSDLVGWSGGGGE
jgi:hypothetical protein